MDFSQTLYEQHTQWLAHKSAYNMDIIWYERIVISLISMGSEEWMAVNSIAVHFDFSNNHWMNAYTFQISATCDFL